jgi:hypothetical protein
MRFQGATRQAYHGVLAVDFRGNRLKLLQGRFVSGQAISPEICLQSSVKQFLSPVIGVN